MKNILFYQDAALELNKKVQKNIGRHLVLFCNYDPSLPEVLSTDAKFFKAVTNLYKLLVDSGIIKLITDISKAGGINFKINILRGYQQLSNTLRTVVCHNPTEMSGEDENQRQYESWLKKYTGKESIDSENDYEKPLEELERIADDIVSLLDKFINSAAKTPKRQEVVDGWENAIINFYCKNSNKNIFINQINFFYCALFNKNKDDNLNNLEVPRWIRDNYYLKEETQRLKVLKSQPLDKFDDGIKTKIIEAIQKTEDQLKTKKIEIAHKLGCSMEELNKHEYYYEDCYFSELRPKLKKITITIRQSYGKTMMPYDLMQDIFYDDFCR